VREGKSPMNEKSLVRMEQQGRPEENLAWFSKLKTPPLNRRLITRRFPSPNLQTNEQTYTAT